MPHHTMITTPEGRLKQNPEMAACIAACLECHQMCLETISYCLQKGGDHAAPDHIRLLEDCAQICSTSADFMMRGSEHHEETCGVCATVCNACAEDCGRFGNDAQMKACAEACRRCAQSCEGMASG